MAISVSEIVSREQAKNKIEGHTTPDYDWSGVANSFSSITERGDAWIPTEGNEKFFKHGIVPFDRNKNYMGELSRAQSGWDVFGNMLMQTANEIVMGTLSGIVDLITIAGNLLTLKGFKQENWNNSWSDAMHSAQESIDEAFPIYTDPDINISNGGLTNGSYIAQGIPSIASTIALFIPVLGAAKAASYAGKAGRFISTSTRLGRTVTSGAKVVGKTAATYSGARSVGRWLANSKAGRFMSRASTRQYLGRASRNIAEGVTMRTLENYQECRQVFNDMYAESLAELQNMTNDEYIAYVNGNRAALGIDENVPDENLPTREELCRRIAGRAADKTFAFDFWNTAFDIWQLWTLRGQFGKSRLASTPNSPAIRKANRISKMFPHLEAKAAVEAYKSLPRKTRLGYWTLDHTIGWGNVLLSEASEGVEESINTIAQSEGMYLGRTLLGTQEQTPYNSTFGGRFWNEYINDPQLWDSAFWGVAGGVGFHVANSAVNRVRNAKNYEEKDEDGNPISKPNVWFRLFDEMPDVKRRVSDINHRYMLYTEYRNDMAEIENGYIPNRVDDKGQKVKFSSKVEQEATANRRRALYMQDLAFTSLHNGNFDLTYDYVASDNFAKMLAEQTKDEDGNSIGIEKAKEYQSEMLRELANTKESYIAELDKLDSLSATIKRKINADILDEHLQIIAANNVRHKSAAEYYKLLQQDCESEYNKIVSTDQELMTDLDTINGLLEYYIIDQELKSLIDRKHKLQKALETETGDKYLANIELDEINKEIDTYYKKLFEKKNSLSFALGLKSISNMQKKFAALDGEIVSKFTIDLGQGLVNALNAGNYTVLEQVLGLNSGYFKSILDNIIENENDVTIASIKEKFDNVEELYDKYIYSDETGLSKLGVEAVALGVNIPQYRTAAKAEEDLIISNVSQLASRMAKIDKLYDHARQKAIKNSHDTVARLGRKYGIHQVWNNIKQLASEGKFDESKYTPEEARDLHEAVNNLQLSNPDNRFLYLKLLKTLLKVEKEKEDKRRTTDNPGEDPNANLATDEKSNTNIQEIEDESKRYEEGKDVNVLLSRKNGKTSIVKKGKKKVRGNKPTAKLRQLAGTPNVYELETTDDNFFTNDSLYDKRDGISIIDGDFKVARKPLVTVNQNGEYEVVKTGLLVKLSDSDEDVSGNESSQDNQDNQDAVTPGDAVVTSEDLGGEEGEIDGNKDSLDDASDDEYNDDNDDDNDDNEEGEQGGGSAATSSTGEGVIGGQGSGTSAKSTARPTMSDPIVGATDADASRNPLQLTTDELIRGAQLALGWLFSDKNSPFKLSEHLEDDFAFLREELIEYLKQIITEHNRLANDEDIEVAVDLVIDEYIQAQKQLKEYEEGSVEATAMDLIYSSRLEEHVPGEEFSEMFKAMAEAFLNQYAKLVLVPTVTVNGKTKKAVSIAEILRICNQARKCSNNAIAVEMFQNIKEYLLNTKEGREKYFVTDARDVESGEALNNASKSSEELAQERNQFAGLYEIQTSNILDDIDSGQISPSLAKKFYDAIDSLAYGDTVRLDNLSKYYVDIVSNGVVIGRMGIPRQIGPDGYLQYNDGWGTDIRLDANGNIVSEFKNLLERLFTHPDKDCESIRQLIADIHAKRLVDKNYKLAAAEINAFINNPIIAKVIADSIAKVTTQKAQKQDYNTLMMVYADKGNRIPYDKLINGLCKIYDYIKPPADPRVSKESKIIESLNDWFTKLYDTYTYTIHLVNEYKNNGISEVQIGKVTKGTKNVKVNPEDNVDVYENISSIKESVSPQHEPKIALVSAQDKKTVIISNHEKVPSNNIGEKGTVLVYIGDNGGRPVFVQGYPVRLQNQSKVEHQSFSPMLTSAFLALKDTVEDYGTGKGSFAKITETLFDILADNGQNDSSRSPLLRALNGYFSINDFFENGYNGVIIKYKDKSTNNYYTFKIYSKHKNGTVGFRVEKSTFDSNTKSYTTERSKLIGLTNENSKDFYESFILAFNRFVSPISQFNISEDEINNDNNKTGKSKGFFKRVNGKLVVDIKHRNGGFHWEGDSYNQFVIEHNLVRANTFKGKDGTNFDRRGTQDNKTQIFITSKTSKQTTTKKQPTPKPATAKKEKVKIDTYIEKDSVPEDYSKSVAILNSDSKRKGDELVSQVVGDNFADEILEADEGNDVAESLFPNEIVFDPELNDQKEDENGRIVYKGPVASVNTSPDEREYRTVKDTRKKIAGRSVVVGTHFMNMISSKNPQRRKQAIRNLFHEKVHILLAEHVANKTELFKELEKIYDEFVEARKKLAAKKDKTVEEIAILNYITDALKGYKKGDGKLLEEFLVESLTAGSFIKFLNNTESKVAFDKSNKETLFTRILRFIMKLFKYGDYGKINENSLLNRELNLLKNIDDENNFNNLDGNNNESNTGNNTSTSESSETNNDAKADGKNYKELLNDYEKSDEDIDFEFDSRAEETGLEDSLQVSVIENQSFSGIGKFLSTFNLAERQDIEERINSGEIQMYCSI